MFSLIFVTMQSVGTALVQIAKEWLDKDGICKSIDILTASDHMSHNDFINNIQMLSVHWFYQFSNTVYTTKENQYDWCPVKPKHTVTFSSDHTSIGPFSLVPSTTPQSIL